MSVQQRIDSPEGPAHRARQDGAQIKKNANRKIEDNIWNVRFPFMV